MTANANTPAPESTESRIMVAATELFYERGYHATTMRDIAAAVGIKAGSLYNHYPGKQDILVRISLQTTRELHAGALSRIQGIDDVELALRRFLEWHVVFHARNRLPSRVADGQLHALSDENRRAVMEVRDAHEELFKGLIRRGIEAGLWNPAHPNVIGIGVLTMCTEVDAWFREDGAMTAEQVAETFAQFILDGLHGSRPA